MGVLDLDDLPEITGTVQRRLDGRVVAGRWAGGWYALDLATGGLALRDPDGDVVAEPWSLPVDGLGPTGPVAVDPAGALVAVGERDHVRLVDRSGEVRRLDLPSWGPHRRSAVVFDPAPGPARLWVAAPAEAARGLLPQPPAGELLLVDPARAAVLGRAVLGDDHPEGYELRAAPGSGVLLAGAYGQDGARAWCLTIHGDAIEARSLGWTGVAVDVDGARGEILCTPHDDEDVQLLSWDDGSVLRSVDGTDVFGDPESYEELDDEPDGFDYGGAFVDDDRLVVLTRSERALVFDRRTGAPLGRLVVGGGDLNASVVTRIAPGRLVAQGRETTLVALS